VDDIGPCSWPCPDRTRVVGRRNQNSRFVILQTRSHYVTNDLAVLRGKDCPYLSCASHAVNSSIKFAQLCGSSAAVFIPGTRAIKHTVRLEAGVQST
jgi:hypothetical protein